MTFSNKTLGLLAGIALLVPVTGAAPAAAADVAPTQCHLLLAGPTPAAEVDTNNDGNPELRVPSVTNVRLCVTSDVTLNPPSVESTDCGAFLTCKAFYVDYNVSGSVGAQMVLCHTIDGRQVCGMTTPIRVPLDAVDGGRMCVGYDFAGGSPCGNGQLIAFE